MLNIIKNRASVFNILDRNNLHTRKDDRNVDVVPRLTYFARVTDILGSLQNNDLPFI